ncbi:MAG: hypothetical protein AM326_11445 [Candidatus Thorarchaeota archaeon SMTZ-45]|nr:MAG: hypothetical protein AM326_11445 [Candidatus Thorarchaeota archaeon SMTZ-45]KXH73893.1 MAG: hypothetical protein AM325_06820 [Candidatus Thorarchaeota archaeon SMTZ1-45]
MRGIIVLEGWSLGNLIVKVELGYKDDSDIDVVVKAKDIELEREKATITVRENSNAKEVLYWPGISLKNPDRRAVIYSTALWAMETAIGLKARKVGFFTMGLEVSRIPSWEVAEEIVRAIASHSKTVCDLNKILLVASSPIQLSSFQFALNNIKTISNERAIS